MKDRLNSMPRLFWPGRYRGGNLVLTLAGPSSVLVIVAFSGLVRAKPGRHTRSEESAADIRTIASRRLAVCR